MNNIEQLREDVFSLQKKLDAYYDCSDSYKERKELEKEYRFIKKDFFKANSIRNFRLTSKAICGLIVPIVMITSFPYAFFGPDFDLPGCTREATCYSVNYADSTGNVDYYDTYNVTDGKIDDSFEHNYVEVTMPWEYNEKSEIYCQYTYTLKFDNDVDVKQLATTDPSVYINSEDVKKNTNKNINLSAEDKALKEPLVKAYEFKEINAPKVRISQRASWWTTIFCSYWAINKIKDSYYKKVKEKLRNDSYDYAEKKEQYAKTKKLYKN